MVVMDKEDYTDKALSLLADTSTYWIINKEPTTKLKNKLTQMLRASNKKEDSVTTVTGKYIPLVRPTFYGLPKIHKVGTPSGPLCPVGVPLHMVWQRRWQTSLTLGWSVSTPP